MSWLIGSVWKHHRYMNLTRCFVLWQGVHPRHCQSEMSVHFSLSTLLDFSSPGFLYIYTHLRPHLTHRNDKCRELSPSQICSRLLPVCDFDPLFFLIFLFSLRKIIRPLYLCNNRVIYRTYYTCMPLKCSLLPFWRYRRFKKASGPHHCMNKLVRELDIDWSRVVNGSLLHPDVCNLHANNTHYLELSSNHSFLIRINQLNQWILIVS